MRYLDQRRRAPAFRRALLPWSLLVAGCSPPPLGPDPGGSPCDTPAAGPDGLQLVDLGRGDRRDLLPGGGWAGAVWVGCSPWLLLDRTVRGERSPSFLDLEEGRLLPAGLPERAPLASDPVWIEAVAAVFGEDAAYPLDRVDLGALLRGDDGRPVVEIVARAVASGETEAVVGTVPLELPAPVARAVGEASRCGDPPGFGWVLRTDRAAQRLGGPPAVGWVCESAAAEDGPNDGPPGVVGTRRPAPDLPPRVTVDDGPPVPVDDAGLWTAVTWCRRPGGDLAVARVDRDGAEPASSYHVLSRAGGCRLAGRHLQREPAVIGVAEVAPGVLVFGADTWWRWTGQGEPEPLGTLPPAVRPVAAP